MPVSFVLLAWLTTYAVAQPQKCVSTHFDEEAEVDYVIDGDTVILSDERHVRLIGIDTPEIFHDGRPTEAGALAARRFLKALTEAHPWVGLKYDSERRDRHGRTLAHLFLPDGQNVQAQLLEKGLARPLFIPPSVGLADCYAEVARKARYANSGLWANEDYQPRTVASLTGRERGFHILQGRVRYVSASRSALWVNLENNVALRITRSDLDYFDDDLLKRLPGNRVEAHGWIYRRNDQLRMRIRYPLNLTIMKDQ